MNLVIAKRVLKLTTDGSERDVTVAVCEPYATDDGQNYFCPFSIEGIAATSIRGAYGVDAVQALQLAMKAIGASLYTLREYELGKLRWLDSSEDLGFPKPQT